MKKWMTGVLALSVLSVAIASPASAADEPKKKPDPEAQFKKLDKDSDGKLTFEEFKGKREEAKAKPMFERKDKDKDGKLTLEEFKAQPKKKAE
ncbi:MAG: EF-hand domain-containing protein [Planctomycetaceae bacterium]